MKLCYKCSTIREGGLQPGLRECCSKCGEDLHVCLNCKFYDTSKSSQCQESKAEFVLNKEKANFCEEFQFIEKRESKPVIDETAKAKEQWRKLFPK